MTHHFIPIRRRSSRWFSDIPPYLTICAPLKPRLLEAQGNSYPFLKVMEEKNEK